MANKNERSYKTVKARWKETLPLAFGAAVLVAAALSWSQFIAPKAADQITQVSSGFTAGPQASAAAPLQEKILAWPVAGHPAYFENISTWAEQEELSLDIIAKNGSEILAPADGSIAAITKLEGGSHVIVMDHGDFLMTIFAMAKSKDIWKGKAVSRGDVIGTVFNEEDALYMEVRKGFSMVNPLDYLDAGDPAPKEQIANSVETTDALPLPKISN